jgi:putative oxidoreductase
MKILTFLIRILLGLAFVVFGLNGFLQFMPPPPKPFPALATEFTHALMASKYFWAVAGLQLVGGLLLLINRVPLGLTLLGPVVVNIVLFHVFLERSGLPIAAVFGALTLFLLWRNKEAFPAIFPKSAPAKSAKK